MKSKEEPKLDTVGKEFYENADMTITIKRQETLEETCETELYKTINTIIDGGKDLPKGITVSRSQAVDYAFNVALKSAKLQAEKMYSEKDLISFAHFYFEEEFNSTMQTSKSTNEVLQEWKEFKKK